MNQKAFKMLITRGLTKARPEGRKKLVLVVCASIRGRPNHSLAVVCVRKQTLINSRRPQIIGLWWHLIVAPGRALRHHQVHFCRCKIRACSDSAARAFPSTAPALTKLPKPGPVLTLSAKITASSKTLSTQFTSIPGHVLRFAAMGGRRCRRGGCPSCTRVVVRQCCCSPGAPAAAPAPPARKAEKAGRLAEGGHTRPLEQNSALS